MSTLVLGIGNTLLSDEGVGVHVIQALEAQFGEASDVTLLDGGTLSFTLAAAIEDAEKLIVVDASELKSAPGTVKTFINDDMDNFLNGPRRSVHEVGLIDLMTIARLAERLPEAQPDMALITQQYTAVRYGILRPGEDEIHRLRQCWHRIKKKRLKKANGGQAP